MGFFEDLKSLNKKENRLYLILVIWLLIGFTLLQINIIPLIPVIGMIIYVPFLTFCFFLFFLTILRKKNLRDYSILKLFLIFLISLPLVVILSIVFVALFIFSILSYIFFTSWFTIYGCYLAGVKTDKKLYKYPWQKLTRTSVFLGGFITSLFLLFTFFAGIFIFSGYSERIPSIINIVFYVIGLIIIAFYCVGLGFFFKKIYNTWLGIFSLFVVFYAFFLVLKVILGLTSTGGSDIYIGILLIFIDLFILLYSISTILGSQAEILSKQVKYFAIDTAFIWLVFSKAAYEFAANFPYYILNDITFEFVDYIIRIGSGLNLIKNVAVLSLFVVLLIVVGIYEFRKYIWGQKRLKKEVEEEVEQLKEYPKKGKIEDIYWQVADFEDTEENSEEKVEKLAKEAIKDKIKNEE